MPGISTGAAHTEAPTSPAPPLAPSTPKRPCKRPCPNSPAKEAPIFNVPRIDFFPGLNGTPGGPGSSPQDQLGLELQEHVAVAFQARCSKLKSLKDDLAKLTAWLSKISTQWDNSGLPEAKGIGSEVHGFVKHLSQKLAGDTPKGEASSHPSQTPRSYADATRATPSTPSAATPQAKSPIPTSKPPRIFLRLPADHQARTASPHATLALLRQLPDLQIASGIKEVQRVPSGLALHSLGLAETAQIFSRKSTIESAIPGATAEIEQEWEAYAIPNVPWNYRTYTGELSPIDGDSVKEEFTRQTGLQPYRFYAPGKNPDSNTFIMMLPKDPVHKVPSRVTLFGQPVTVKFKPRQARVTQCRHCWGYHNPLKCTRKPRCRICGASDHQEDGHQARHPPQPRCTNCLGKHPADQLDCPLRPSLHQGVLRRPTKIQARALRRAGSRHNPQLAEQAPHRPAEPGTPTNTSQCA